MSFLAPLYFLGALAVSLPVLFHMIRRTPRDRREFSSTMFLQASPPKITRRSRIEHWLLLLLRGLAVCLLALAFARPFFRHSEQQPLDSSAGQAFVVLVDTSASMQREGVWPEAVTHLEQFLDEEVAPVDRVAVLAFDEALHPVCDFDQWTALDPPQRLAAVMSSLQEATPGWGATNLAAALIEAAERLDALEAPEGAPPVRRVILISDLQSGSNLDMLQTYDWPTSIVVELRPIGNDASPNNAGVHVMADVASGPATAEGPQQMRVQVVNAPGADQDEFTIRWGGASGQFPAEAAAGGPPAAESVSVIVPAGQSRIVRAAPRPEGGGDRLVLEGDDHSFDNICHVPPARPRSARIAMLGAAGPADPRGMEFYLSAALPSLPQRQIELSDWNKDRNLAAGPPQLVIVTAAAPSTEIDALRDYAEAGGTILWAAPDAEALESVFALLDVPQVTIEDAGDQDYAMLTSIDFTHPLFAALRDPRFSDFTKVRFWRHRVLPAEAIPNARVVASFDNGDAAVIDVPAGGGRLILLTSGWHPDDSQLAASTRFVPMLNGLVDDVAGIVEHRTTYYVGESVSLAEFDLTPADIEAIRRPDGERARLEADATTFLDTREPGIYTFVLQGARPGDNTPPSFAVNMNPAESRTARMTDEILSAAGVQLLAEETVQRVDEAAQRQLRAGELENQQKLWRWVVIAVIVLLILETLLASRAARRQLSTA
jgi:hypothetical protein